MFLMKKYQRYLKTILLVIIFALLLLNITHNIKDIYMTSSTSDYICVPIVMYHQVKNTSLGKDVISPYEFKSDLEYLKKNDFHTITMTELIDYVYEDKELPENPIILSFDDGYLNTYKYVFPLLKEYNMKIVLSIVGKSTDDFSRVVDNNVNYAHMTWDEVKEMKESGLVDIQNHTYNMHKVKNGRYGCGQMANESVNHYEQILTEDIAKFQEQTKSRADVTPNTFTYPYGKYNDNTNIILKKLDYKASLSCTFGVNLINKDPERLFGLKRMCRSHNVGIGKLIRSGMETLKYVDK